MRGLRPQSAKINKLHKYTQDQVTSKEQQRQQIARHHKSKFFLKQPLQILGGMEFGRIVPKNIYQDKERLYSEALQLKQSLNMTIDENMRLRTRITILEREKEKIKKYLDGQTKQELSVSIGNVFTEKENYNGLKKMLKQSKEQLSYVKEQYEKVKKSVKYTKITELETERRELHEQAGRLKRIIDKYAQNELENMSYLEQIRKIERQLQRKNTYINQIESKLKKKEAMISFLEQKIRKTPMEGTSQREEKLLKELTNTKKKLTQCLYDQEQLRRQMLKQNDKRPQGSRLGGSRQQIIEENPKKLSRNNKRLQSHTPSQQNRNKQATKSTSKQQPRVVESRVEVVNKSVNQIRKQSQHNKRLSNLKEDEKKLTEGGEMERIQYVNPKKKVSSTENIKKQVEKKEQVTVQPIRMEENYQQHFEEEEKSQQRQQVIRKTEEPRTIQNKKNASGVSHKKQLQSIRELLNYRMKAQRYTFKQLKQDILGSGQSSFSVVQIGSMLNQQPFYLTQQQVHCLLIHLFDTSKLRNDLQITTQTFLNKLKDVITVNTLAEKQVEEQMFMKIAELVADYSSELMEAFDSMRNGENTISKFKLRQILQQLQLSNAYIEMIIGELCIGSEDLEHLNYHIMFKTFCFDDQQASGELRQVDQENQQPSEMASAANTISKPIKQEQKSRRVSNRKQQLLQQEQPFNQQQYLEYQNQSFSMKGERIGEQVDYEVISDEEI